MTVPALYAYSFPLLELKYLYFLFPMFCIFTTFSLKPIFEKFKKNNILFLIFFILILSSSILFTDYKFDYQKEHEAVIIAEYVVKNTKVINSYYPESMHIHGIKIVDEWKTYQEFFQNNERVTGIIDSMNPIVTIVSTNEYQTLDSFLNNSENKKITHLILDGSNNQPDFLIEIFYDEQKYDFIEKIYDSKDNNFEYHVKIFQVN